MFYFFPKDKCPLRVDFQLYFSNVNCITVTRHVNNEKHTKFLMFFLTVHHELTIH